MTHTPGPWVIGENIHYSINTAKLSKIRKHIAMVSDYRMKLSPEESLSNAYLIAAAPELLRVLTKVHKLYKLQYASGLIPNSEVMTQYIDEMGDVIAKAIGKE